MIIYAWLCLHEQYILSFFCCCIYNIWLLDPSRFTLSWNMRHASFRGFLARKQPPLWRSVLKLGHIWVGGDFGSSSGRRGMFEPVTRQRGMFWFTIASFKQLVAISDVRRESNKYEEFLQRAGISFPWVHSFLGFLRERGQKGSLFFFSQIRFCRSVFFLFFGAGCYTLS